MKIQSYGVTESQCKIKKRREKEQFAYISEKKIFSSHLRGRDRHGSSSASWTDP